MIVVVGSVELGPATRFRTRRHFRPFWSRASDLRPGPGCRTLPSFAPSVLADAPPGCRRRITHGGVGKAWPRGTGPLRRRGGQRTGRSLDGYGKRVESRGTGCDPARIQRIRSGTPAPIGGSGDADRHGHRQGFRRRPDSRIGLRSGRLPGQTVQFRRIGGTYPSPVAKGVQQRPPTLSVGDLRLDPASRQVFRGEVELDLSPKEFSLLELFMENPGVVLTRTLIIEQLWDYE